jgi:antitoxin MazE
LSILIQSINIKSHIGRWVNSLAIGTPKYIADELALGVNDEVDCRLEKGQLIVVPVQKIPKYTLSELLSQELEIEPEIDWGKPSGAEEW